jgi:hypothetical protein
MIKMIFKKYLMDRKSLKETKADIEEWSKRFDELYDELHALKQKRGEIDEEKFVEEYIRITDEIDIAIHNKKELQRKIGENTF